MSTISVSSKDTQVYFKGAVIRALSEIQSKHTFAESLHWLDDETDLDDFKKLMSKLGFVLTVAAERHGYQTHMLFVNPKLQVTVEGQPPAVGSCVATFELEGGSLEYSFHSPLGNVARGMEVPFLKALEEFRAEDPPELEDDEVDISVAFFQDGLGPRFEHKTIKCPSWKDIEDNYTGEVQGKVTALLSKEEPDSNGKFILWHGKPGTGKTWAIRSLLREWREKANFLVISDPERFFSDYSYINSALLDQMEGGDHLNVLIVEDSPDLLVKESRISNSQPMQRLLNLTDGLIGQGMRFLILITTNQDIEDIDDAFTRKGRCVQNLKFVPMTETESKTWLKAKGVREGDVEEGSEPKLADLYDRVNTQKHDDYIASTSE